MTKKVISSLTLFLIMSIGNFYISAYFHTILSAGTLYSPTLSIGGFLKTISYVTSSTASGFFLLLEVASLLFIIYILYSQHVRHLSSDVRKITPDIITPISAGHGEYGTARWQSDEEKRKNFAYKSLPLTDSIYEYMEELKIGCEKTTNQNSEENKTITSNTN